MTKRNRRRTRNLIEHIKKSDGLVFEIGNQLKQNFSPWTLKRL